MNYIKLALRNLVFCFILINTSCGELFNPDTEYYFVSDDSKEWLIDTGLYEEFTLVDSLTFSENFHFEYEWENFNSSKRSSGLFGLQDREFKQYEVIHQKYLSQQETRFSIKIEGAEPPEGTTLNVQLKNTQFSYDLFNKKLLSVNTEFGNKPESEIINDKLVELSFLSAVIVHDTLRINEDIYLNVLEFVLSDFKDQWADSTIVSFAMAKELGLIQYKLQSGRVFNRAGD